MADPTARLRDALGPPRPGPVPPQTSLANGGYTARPGPAYDRHGLVAEEEQQQEEGGEG